MMFSNIKNHACIWIMRWKDGKEEEWGCIIEEINKEIC